MKRKTLAVVIVALMAMTLLCGTALAVDESEVQTAIANSSREQVAGNIFIWFLCAIAFLKISQKIDSFMASLGINVGRTGGSMMAEMLIAGRALAGAAGATGHSITNLFGRGGGGGSATQPAGAAFTGGGGGLLSRVSRAAGNAAAGSVTEHGSGLGSFVGGAMFGQSLKHNGSFSTDVTSAVATGSISSVGTMKGSKAAQALTSYLGYSATTGAANAAAKTGAATAGGQGITPTPDGVPSAAPSVPPSAPADGGVPPADPGVSITLDGGAAGVAAAPDLTSAAVAGEFGDEGEGFTPPAPPQQQAGGQAPIAAEPPKFSHVEIGGGRITGYETPAEGGEARQFAMYNANQYMEPTGDYEMVQTVDGESWYKQYAVPTVQKTPKEVTDKGVVYDQKIVQQLPQIPKRKDKV